MSIDVIKTYLFWQQYCSGCFTALYRQSQKVKKRLSPELCLFFFLKEALLETLLNMYFTFLNTLKLWHTENVPTVAFSLTCLLSPANV